MKTSVCKTRSTLGLTLRSMDRHNPNRLRRATHRKRLKRQSIHFFNGENRCAVVNNKENDVMSDLPSSKRIWELASVAIRVEASAYEEDITMEEVYSGILRRDADSVSENLSPDERQFFETVLDAVCR